jgi:hypothetical protein
MRKPRLNATSASNNAAEDDISLFRGGLFYRLQLQCNLIGVHGWNLPRRIALILAVAWLPLVIITALFGRDQLGGLLKDYVVYSRIVIAVPALLIGQLFMEWAFRTIISHVKEAELLGEEDLRKFDGVIAIQKRLRDSDFPELIILALVFADLVLLSDSKVANAPAWATIKNGGMAHLSAAGWYYGLVSVPIYQFLMGLNLWKWILWAFFALRLSRMDLKLVATHLDGHGGLGFLSLSPAAFGATAFAVSTAIGGAWRDEILHSGRRLASFELPVAILLVLLFAVGLGPLCFFVERLTTLRKTAMLKYGILAQLQATDFHDRWISDHRSREKEPLGMTEATKLIDLAISYDCIKRMWPFPIDKSTLVGFALAILVPLVPVVLAEIPFSAIVNGLFEAVKAVPI